MKQILKSITVLLPILLIIGCISEPPSPQDQESGDNLLLTKSAEMDGSYYYWYRGEKISLTVDKSTVNIVVDTSVVKNTSVSNLCMELNLKMVTQPDGSGMFKASLNQDLLKISSYNDVVSRLRNDSRIKSVLPFFKRGAGVEPIGTSPLFYVQLKEIIQDEKISEQIP